MNQTDDVHLAVHPVTVRFSKEVACTYTQCAGLQGKLSQGASKARFSNCCRMLRTQTSYAKCMLDGLPGYEHHHDNSETHTRLHLALLTGIHTYVGVCQVHAVVLTSNAVTQTVWPSVPLWQHAQMACFRIKPALQRFSLMHWHHRINECVLSALVH